MEVITLDQAPVRMYDTPEGYLRGEAVVTRTGIFTYKTTDGGEMKQLRHPSEVFKKASLDTLRQIPVTLNHPPEMVTAATAKRYSVGYTGDAYNTDNQGNVIVSFTITDAQAVLAVKQGGKRQLSLGYYQNLLPEQGLYDGQAYTHRQTDIRYNHLAIVDQARAGNVATINTDDLLTQLIYCPTEDSTMPTDVRMDAVTHNGITYQVPPEVRVAMDSMTTTIAASATEKQEAQKAFDTLKANFDAATAKVIALEEAAKTVEASFDSKLQKAVVKRLELVAKVAKVCTVDGFESKTDKELMLAAIVAKHPSFDATDKSMDYLQARFDAVVEEAAKTPNVPLSIAKQRQGSMDSAPTVSKAITTANLFEAWAAS